MENKLLLKKKFITKDKSHRLYEIDCPVIGLTGGIATGKSTASTELEKLGIPVICADKLVKEVYKDQSTIQFIRLTCPEAIDGNDIIDFKVLREIFFSDSDLKLKIETQIYSLMPAKFVERYQSFNNPNFIVYDVPLLFEKGLDLKVDVKALVYCPKEEQVKRLIKRDNISRELALKIISSQIDIEDKKKKCDVILDNSIDLKSGIADFLDTLTE